MLFALHVLVVFVFRSIGITSVFADAYNGFIPTTVSSVTNTFSDVSIASLDGKAELEFYGETNGWAIIAGQAFPSNIILVASNAVHQNNGFWKVKSSATTPIGDRENIPLVLKGQAVNGKL